MIERPRIGSTYEFRPSRGATAKVRVKGFRKGFVETEDAETGAHRSCSRKQLHEVTQ